MGESNSLPTGTKEVVHQALNSCLSDFKVHVHRTKIKGAGDTFALHVLRRLNFISYVS